MSGPWENYQAQSQEEGPWTNYAPAGSSQPDSSASQIALQAGKAAITGPLLATKAALEHPEALGEHLPTLGAVGGEILAGPPGAAIGAGLGQIGKRMAGMAFGTEPPSRGPLREAIAPVAQSLVAGLPGLTGVKGIPTFLGKADPTKETLSQVVMKGYAKAGETVSGVKKDVLEQATKQGFSTYGAPSLPRAQEIFAEAIGPEGQAAMKTTAEQAFDPALGQARAKAVEIGTKIEKGEPVTAIEALQARQATDRVISATSWKDKLARKGLYNWRTKFDDVMTGQSGPLADASTQYRQAIVKDKILTPTRMNKTGEPSALLPILAGLAGPVAGYQQGHTGKGVVAGVGALAASSPITWGLGATTLGAINPTVRQALLTELLSRMDKQRKGG